MAKHIEWSEIDTEALIEEYLLADDARWEHDTSEEENSWVPDCYYYWGSRAVIGEIADAGEWVPVLNKEVLPHARRNGFFVCIPDGEILVRITLDPSALRRGTIYLTGIDAERAAMAMQRPLPPVPELDPRGLLPWPDDPELLEKVAYAQQLARERTER